MLFQYIISVGVVLHFYWNNCILNCVHVFAAVISVKAVQTQVMKATWLSFIDMFLVCLSWAWKIVQDYYHYFLHFNVNLSLFKLHIPENSYVSFCVISIIMCKLFFIIFHIFSRVDFFQGGFCKKKKRSRISKTFSVIYIKYTCKCTIPHPFWWLNIIVVYKAKNSSSSCWLGGSILPEDILV